MINSNQTPVNNRQVRLHNPGDAFCDLVAKRTTSIGEGSLIWARGSALSRLQVSASRVYQYNRGSFDIGVLFLFGWTGAEGFGKTKTKGDFAWIDGGNGNNIKKNLFWSGRTSGDGEGLNNGNPNRVTRTCEAFAHAEILDGLANPLAKHYVVQSSLTLGFNHEVVFAGMPEDSDPVRARASGSVLVDIGEGVEQSIDGGSDVWGHSPNAGTLTSHRNDAYANAIIRVQ